MSNRMYYRKEKLCGACWEYEVMGGWIVVPTACGERRLLHHRFSFYRPRPIEVRTTTGVTCLERAAAEQWFFPDRWFSLLRFTTREDETVGYYVNFSLPLREVRANYYSDLDLELDLWLEPDGTATEVDRDEFDAEIAAERLPLDWASAVDTACSQVTAAVTDAVTKLGPGPALQGHPHHGLPEFILAV